ncbi:protein kinase [Kitasatospora sp. NPDC052896]|uniref:serine/threonine protein kinase n=1 Tax=Kitasatospora sp. NPDC052896 TaxID=3364061 RepID=UPI0037C5928B
MWGQGTVLNGRYRLIELIGVGSTGHVWRAVDDVLGRSVAVKILLPELLEDPAFAERFRTEVGILAWVSHPGVVSVYDYGETTDPRAAFLVTELLDGRPLSEVLAEAGRLDPVRALTIAAQTLDALQAAHDGGIVHRDVRPANLLLRGETVVVTDFGVARTAGTRRPTAGGTEPGTAVHGAPGQSRQGALTAAADVYAVGVIAYECLTGASPFDDGSSPAVIRQHVREPVPPLPEEIPAAVRKLVQRALAKDPADRFRSAAAMARAIRVVLPGLTSASQAPAGEGVGAAVDWVSFEASVGLIAKAGAELGQQAAEPDIDAEPELPAQPEPVAEFATGQEPLAGTTPEPAPATGTVLETEPRRETEDRQGEAEQKAPRAGDHPAGASPGVLGEAPDADQPDRPSFAIALTHLRTEREPEREAEVESEHGAAATSEAHDRPDAPADGAPADPLDLGPALSSKLRSLVDPVLTPALARRRRSAGVLGAVTVALILGTAIARPTFSQHPHAGSASGGQPTLSGSQAPATPPAVLADASVSPSAGSPTATASASASPSATDGTTTTGRPSTAPSGAGSNEHSSGPTGQPATTPPRPTQAPTIPAQQPATPAQPPSTASTPPPPPRQPGEITNYGDNTAIDVASGATSNGTQLIEWHIYPTLTGQHWTMQPTTVNGTSGYYLLNGLNSNAVMSLGLSSKVDLWQAGSWLWQLWLPEDSSVGGFSYLHNALTGQCLTDNGLQTQVTLAPCSANNPAQMWSLPS